jgi:predicted secreted protein
MKQIALGFLVLLALASAPASAATADDLRIIGYSKDGKYFAYETFGVADGSGAPYATIYVLDVAQDKWVKGTPVSSSFGEEAHDTALPAQLQVRQRAAPILAKLDIRYPYRELASVAAGQKVADPHKMQFKRFHNISKLWTVQLSEIDLKAAQECYSASGTKGFKLSVGKGDEQLKEVYRDKRLPASRYCPVGYKLAKVVESGNETASNTSVVLVHTFSPGFEGNDATFLAVPVRLPD